MSELLKVYPVHDDKPQVGIGIEPETRTEALKTLKAYYHPGRETFGYSIEFDSFRDVRKLLNLLIVDNKVGTEVIQSFFKSLPKRPDVGGIEFLQRSNRLLRWIKEQAKVGNLPTFFSCPYKEITAFSQKRFATVDLLGDGGIKYFLVGAVGSSGAHEFFSLTQEKEIQLLQRSLFEALIVKGFPIPFKDEQKENELLVLLANVSKTLLSKRREESPYDWSTNCLTLQILANAGVREIAKITGYELNDSNYKVCTMGRFNNDHSPSFEDQGLPIPASLGRLDCPSQCAEFQATERLKYATAIPLITGEKDIIIYAIGRNEIIIPDYGCGIPSSELIYIVPKGDKFKFKSLVMDNRLCLDPIRPNSSYPYLSCIYGVLESMGINLSKYKKIIIYLDDIKNELIIFSGKVIGNLSDATYLASSDKELARIKWNEIVRTSVSELLQNKEDVGLWTSALPCVHCTNKIQENGVEHLHIDSLNWPKFKGDDGLILEYLMTHFSERMSVGRHVF